MTATLSDKNRSNQTVTSGDATQDAVAHPAPRGLGAWLEERTGLLHATNRLLHWPVPGYVAWSIPYALGGLTLISLIVQFFTGFCLAFYYVPDVEAAYNSVDFITYQAPLGWLIRSLHHYNAGVIVALVVLHTLRTFFYGSYKSPRELTWLSGVALLFITLGFGFTGYLLPWDQKGYWATVVGTEMVGKVPLWGDTLTRLLRGGAQLGQLTLTRFYVIHVAVLPGLLLLLTLLHLQQHRWHGVAPAVTKREIRHADQPLRYFPHWAVTEAFFGLLLLAGLLWLSWTVWAPLEFPANPADTDYNPTPEWYFLFLFKLLHYVPGHLEPWVLVLVPLLFIGSMILLPFVDRRAERHPWRRPVGTTIAMLIILVIIVFTWLAL